MDILRALAPIIGAISAFVPVAVAQPVHVEGGGGYGQGYLFRHEGVCWLATAGHLLGEGGNFAVTVAGQPPLRGGGEAAAPFWAGLDLALGIVRGEAADACTTGFENFARPWTRAMTAGGLRLPHVAPDGTVDAAAMRIVDLPDHKSFVAEFTDGAPAFPGRSGSFLAMGDRLAGMVVTEPEGEVHGLVRIEEIAMNAERWITMRGETLIAAAEPVTVRQQAGFAVAIDSTTTTLEPATLGSDPETVLTGDAPFMFTGTGRIVLKVADGSLQELRGLRIESHGPEAAPKAVTVEIDPGAEGPLLPAWFWSGTMDQAGHFDTGERAPRGMRRVIITFSSAWGAGPRRIDRITLY